MKYKSLFDKKKITFSIFLFTAIIFPFLLPNQYYIHIFVLAGVFIILALGLNIAVGFAGLLNLGYVAFYAVGAYTFALLNINYNLSFWEALPISILCVIFFALIIGIPTLRVRGDYLALVTLGFGEILRLILRNWDSLTNGPKGISGIKSPVFFGVMFSKPIHFYYLVLCLFLITYFLINRWNNSKIGRAWFATRDDETAAKTMGINTMKFLLHAFVISAAFAGLMGAFFASWQGFISPESFVLMETIIILSMVVLGLGSIRGVIVASAVLILIPEFLRGFSQFRMLLFGFVIVIITILKSKGSMRGKVKTYLTQLPLSIKNNPEANTDISKNTLSTEYLLKIEGLTKKFGNLVAVNNLNLAIYKSEIVALIGPNGAGKTTVFNCITGTSEPSAGHIIFSDEIELIGLKTYQIAAMGVRRNFQNIRLFKNMTALENVIVGFHCHSSENIITSILKTPKVKNEEKKIVKKAEKLLEFVNLEEKKDFLSENLSYGEQRRLEIARALATDPQLLLLDEPVTAMNETQQKIILDLIRRIRKEKEITVLLIEHNMKAALGVADRVIVLDSGTKIADDSPLNIQKNEKVREIYLGKEGKKFITKEFVTKKEIKPLLKLNNVWVSYDQIEVLKGITLEIYQGEIIALIGPNGAGKTTTLMTISQILKPQRGEIQYQGNSIIGCSSYEVVKRGIVQIPQGRGIFPRLTVLENIKMGAFLNYDKKSFNENLALVYNLFPILRNREHQYGFNLSGGEQQMLAIARALMASPNMILMDEPSLGLSPTSIERLFEIILTMRKKGVTILLVEQKVKESLEIAERGYILEGGKTKLEDTAENLLNNDMVKKNYLGG